MTIRADAHKPEFHRAAPPQLPVRVASTASVTIATALNAGDSIDGVTLAAGDRVLLKDQSTGSQNGIYIAGVTPARAFDFEEGVAAYGAIIYVVAGTANGGKLFRCTNTTVPTIGSDALTFSDYTPGGSGAPSTADYLVGTAQAGLSAEIVVGTTPGGELGGTWGSPTVDSTHSGSAHTDFIAKSLLTTQDDIIVRDGTGPARLAKGSDGQVLTVDPTTHHLVWATPTSGGAPDTADYLVGTAQAGLSAEIVVGTSPGGELGGTWASPTVDGTHSGSAHSDFIAKSVANAKGDIFTATANDTPTVLTAGSNDQILMADSGQSTGLKWVGSQTPSTQAFSDAAAEGTADTYSRGDHVHGMPSGSAVMVLYPLETPSLNGTYGDDFTDGSLNARWSRHNQTSGEETYAQGPRASALVVAYSTATASRYIYQTAPNGTNETWDCHLTLYQRTATGQMFGLLMVDANGDGIAVCFYDNTAGLYLMTITNHVQTGIAASATSYNFGEYRAGQQIWLQLEKASTTFTGRWSGDGEVWSPPVSATRNLTFTRVGIGRFLGTNANSFMYAHRFNKTA